MSTALSTSQHLTADVSSDQRSDWKAQGPDWKRQLAERLDAYRAKHPDSASPLPAESNRAGDSRASKIARSVASRYAGAPSYSDLLMAAAQAEHAAAQAQAALAERVAEDARIALEKVEHERRAARLAAEREPVLKAEQEAAARMQPGTPVLPQFAERTREMHLHQALAEPEPSLEDLLSSALVEPRSLLPSKLIEFPRELVSAQRPRLRAPEPPPATEPEFVVPEPAQLRIFEVQPEFATAVATESLPPTPEIGIYLPPGRAAAPAQPPASAQFKVPPRAAVVDRSRSSLPAKSQAPTQRPSTAEPDHSTPRIPVSRGAASAPTRGPLSPPRDLNPPAPSPYKGLEWAAISLDKEPGRLRHRRRESSVEESAPFLTDAAPVDRRLMAFAVDFAAVTAGFLGFVVVFAASTPHLPSGLTAAVLGGAVYGLLWLLYQTLFFSFSGATAGMLYARIALCTFDDQNPTRSAMRRRLAAWWLSCLPLGIGFLWCFVDEDNLSWHDRMTRIYQRAY